MSAATAAAADGLCPGGAAEEANNLLGAPSRILIHPTPRTMVFKEILMGNLGYTEGQGIYNSVRSTEAAVRQIQSTLLTRTLNAARYEDVARDWMAHLRARGLGAEALARRFGDEAPAVAERLFDTWYRTLQMALLDFVRGIAACFSASESNGTASFAKYIDWIVCLGVVPVRRARPGGKRRRERCVDEHDLAGHLRVAGSVLGQGLDEVAELAEAMRGVTIMDYDRVQLYYEPRHRRVLARDALTGERGECLVLWQPLWRDGELLFDSPAQRVHGEVLACHALREHARLCQLLNTAPVKVLVGRKPAEGHPAGAVEKMLGEDPAGSAAARLVRLIVNMKGMRHIGDITETVRSYLDETGARILDSVDTSQPGFGHHGAGAQPVQDAFRTSVVNSINGMLEGYVNNLFKTIESLKADNGGLREQVREREQEVRRLREQALRAAQAGADGTGAAGPAGGRAPGAADGQPPRDLGHEVIDITRAMGDDAYVANSFQSRYVPPYESDVERLSRLWEQELIRCFKLTRVANNQGQEVSVSYSNSSISLILAPYFFSILRVRHLGFLITSQEVYRSEEDLCGVVFKKTRLEAYLTEIAALFAADVRRATERLRDGGRDGRADLARPPAAGVRGARGARADPGLHERLGD
ncbi:DNA packaging capsid portal protein [Suid alphaherpesvirus 1]|uniref:UL6 capsid portal protein n=2 Tax=Suid herpesvirus 1 TaxID=10345 RepID=A0AAX7FDR3_SUHV|nr:DNA packaging capsid portal protein [Suid alphaherpesvirus 1]YP_068370.1 capsid portal protein [Suid alphaherpesvirus 1]CAA65913.1 UL6 [Suid herpesvirus 1 strain Kaplan]AEM64065.1 DNA packaging capsid portal protein [Suid alphaherpesvirus 1]AFI70830.1 UL6 [Suid alphaherpesvirus 1]AFI70900.1 UL6 [Suid alphaherpesvirus 1]AFI70969.1 UL6 [Suid alphaherpesvirus 1]